MLNLDSLQATRVAPFHTGFVQPLYDTYNFAGLPRQIQYFLTGLGGPGLAAPAFAGLRTRYDAVVLMYIDALGWRFYEQFKDRSLSLQHFLQHGVVSKITAQFPSTTAAHTTNIHTGLTPAQSGVYEWYIYEPAVDAMIAPLLFSYAGETQREQLKQAGMSPETLFPTQTIYKNLRQNGVASYIYQRADIAFTSPGSVLFDPANVFPYATLTEAFITLGKRLQSQTQPAYHFLYYSPIDTMGHEYGPSSLESEAEVESFLMLLQRQFLDRFAGRQNKKVLLLITSDHGQMDVSPKTTFYINQEIPGFRNYIQLNRRGQPLVPAGSPRDLFLHIRPEMLNEAQHILSVHLEGKALVMPTRDLIDQGYFGPTPASEALLSRVANLCILPFKNESVYWYVKGKYEQKHYGHHGGLSPEEMEIPLLACEL